MSLKNVLLFWPQSTHFFVGVNDRFYSFFFPSNVHMFIMFIKTYFVSISIVNERYMGCPLRGWKKITKVSEKLVRKI